jgi:hypothetical protein
MSQVRYPSPGVGTISPAVDFSVQIIIWFPMVLRSTPEMSIYAF